MPPRRRPRSPYDKAALGTYRGPALPAEAPKVTARVIRLLEAIHDKEIKAGRDGYRGQWRWHRVTVTAQVERLIRCGWAHEVGAHLELTPAGVDALETAQRREDRWPA